jgi:hypothetical protein
MRSLINRTLMVCALAVPAIALVPPSPASASTPSLSGEVLTGTDVITGVCPPPGDAGNMPFTATGHASGPYPGTFTETGYWELDLLVLSAFKSSYVIVSGATTITGTSDFMTGSAFAACDGRAYNVPTVYGASIAAPGGTSAASGTSSVDIVYGTFSRTFGAVTPLAATATATPSAASTGQTVTLSATPSGGTPGYSYAWSLTTPAGSASALSSPTAPSPSFVPDVPGNYRASLVVTDSVGTSTAPTVVSVSATTVVAFQITTVSLPSAVRGMPYSQLLQAVGGTAPYKWKATGTLPKGLKLSGGGLLSGIPKASDPAATYVITVQATTKATKGHPAQTVSQPLSLTLS